MADGRRRSRSDSQFSQDTPRSCSDCASSSPWAFGPWQGGSRTTHRPTHSITGFDRCEVSSIFLLLIGAAGRSSSSDSGVRGCVVSEFNDIELRPSINQGLINRILARFTKTITKPWQMYRWGCSLGSASTPLSPGGAARISGGVGRRPSRPSLVRHLTLPVLFTAAEGMEPARRDRRLLRRTSRTVGPSPSQCARCVTTSRVTVLSVFVAVVIRGIRFSRSSPAVGHHGTGHLPGSGGLDLNKRPGSSSSVRSCSRGCWL